MRSKILILLLTGLLVLGTLSPTLALETKPLPDFGAEDEHPWGGDNATGPTGSTIGGSLEIRATSSYMFIQISLMEFLDEVFGGDYFSRQLIIHFRTIDRKQDTSNSLETTSQPLETNQNLGTRD